MQEQVYRSGNQGRNQKNPQQSQENTSDVAGTITEDDAVAHRFIGLHRLGRLDLGSHIDHRIGDALHARGRDLAAILRRGDIAGGILVAALPGVGGYRLIGRRGQYLAHKVSADDLPLHIGKGESHAVFYCGRWNIGHIVAVQRPDGSGGSNGVAASGVTRRLGGEGRVIQRQLSRKLAVIVSHSGGKMLQDHGEVLFLRLHRDGLHHRLGLQELLLILCGIGPGIVEAIVVKRWLL